MSSAESESSVRRSLRAGLDRIESALYSTQPLHWALKDVPGLVVYMGFLQEALSLEKSCDELGANLGVLCFTTTVCYAGEV